MSDTRNMGTPVDPQRLFEYAATLNDVQRAQFWTLARSNTPTNGELQQFVADAGLNNAQQRGLYTLFSVARPQADLTDPKIHYDDLLDALSSGKLNGEDVDPQAVKDELRRRNQEAGRTPVPPLASPVSVSAGLPIAAPQPPASAPAHGGLQMPRGRRRTVLVNIGLWAVSIFFGLIVAINTIGLIDGALNHLHNAGHAWLTFGYFVFAWAIATVVFRIILAFVAVLTKAGTRYYNSLPQ